MVKQYSLFESFNRFVRKLSKYSPEERKRIVDRLIKLGKGNGGIYSADEYGRRMIDGQVKRVKRIADKNGRRLDIIRSGNVEDSLTSPSIDIRMRKRPVKSWDGTYDPIDVKSYRNSNRGIDTIVLPKDGGLVHADAAAHEADEYAKLFQNSKKIDQNPSMTSFLSYLHNKTSPGKHEVGVLKRETGRRQKLSTVYNTEFPIRNPIEISHNNISVKTLLKYLGSIKDKEKEILSKEFSSKDEVLKILKNQKKEIEDFIRRRDEISKMKNETARKLKLYFLKRDIKNYNDNLAANRHKISFI